MSAYFEIEPHWLTVPTLFIFGLGVVVLSIAAAFVAVWIFHRFVDFLAERGWL